MDMMVADASSMNLNLTDPCHILYSTLCPSGYIFYLCFEPIPPLIINMGTGKKTMILPRGVAAAAVCFYPLRGWKLANILQKRLTAIPLNWRILPLFHNISGVRINGRYNRIFFVFSKGY